MKCVFLALISLLVVISPSRGARILGIFPVACRSHQSVFAALTQKLAERGHELVVATPFPDIHAGNASHSMRHINLMDSVGNYYAEIMALDLYSYDHPLYYPLFYWVKAIRFIELIFSHAKVRSLLQDERGFDLVICEDIVTEALCGFADYFQAPKIMMSSLGGYHMTNYPVGNPLDFAYVPNVLLSMSDSMNFMERLINTVYTVTWELGDRVFYLPRQESLRKQFFGDSTRPLMEMRYDASLVLVNNHFSIGYPRPLLPAMIEVGGLHVQHSVTPLPKDLQLYLDEATDGAIYFAMGSNLRNDAMAAEKMASILSAFAEFPQQRVLMKWESKTILPSQLPSNVRLGKWLPQQSVLAHKNLRVFVTHGGLLSLQEALYHGVPLVGIPVFSDQRFNLLKAQNDGYALTMEIHEVTKQSMFAAINATIHDSRYREAAARRSSLFRDQPETPIDRAVYWTEYVIRHKGAKHLNSAATKLTWYQRCLFDVAAFLFVLTSVLTAGISILIWRYMDLTPRITRIIDMAQQSIKVCFIQFPQIEDDEWISDSDVKKVN